MRRRTSGSDSEAWLPERRVRPRRAALQDVRESDSCLVARRLPRHFAAEGAVFPDGPWQDETPAVINHVAHIVKLM